jgi:hypothetical protein
MSDIYIPEGAYTLDKAPTDIQIRLGIQGPSKYGKSWAGTTFPGCIALSYDRGMLSHQGRSDIVEVPFWSDEFIDRIYPRTSQEYRDFKTGAMRITPPNRMDALIRWVYTEAQKIPSKHTLMLDNNTGIQKAFHQQYWIDPALDNKGELKPWEEFNRKIAHFQDLMVALKSLKCHVVYIAHEMDERDKKNEATGRKRPMLSGAFCSEIQTHFTDWFRAWAVAKPTDEEMRGRFCEKFKPDNLEEWMKSSTNDTVYLWQTQSDEEFTCGTSLINCPKFIVANYNSFLKYRRKVE